VPTKRPRKHGDLSCFVRFVESRLCGRRVEHMERSEMSPAVTFWWNGFARFRPRLVAATLVFTAVGRPNPTRSILSLLRLRRPERGFVGALSQRRGCRIVVAVTKYTLERHEPTTCKSCPPLLHSRAVVLVTIGRGRPTDLASRCLKKRGCHGCPDQFQARSFTNNKVCGFSTICQKIAKRPFVLAA
jgi:hypothetical protein